MRKKFWIILAALLVIALGAAALILSGYTYVGGQFLKKGEKHLRPAGEKPEFS